MSVSNECKAIDNDIIYFIYDCTGLIVDENGICDVEKSIEHKIGDKVYFLDWFYKMVGDNQYTMIKYRDEYGRISSATESFFVTEDVWEGLINYFKSYYDDNL